MLREPGSRRTEVLGVLRNLLVTAPAELKLMMAGQIPLVEGTLAEIERVTEILDSTGAEVSTTCVLPPRAR